MNNRCHLKSLPQLFFKVILVMIASQKLVDATKFDKHDLPIFLEPVENMTVAVGREASLSCSIDNLGKHKVAWVHLDRQLIVAIHRQIVSREQRFFVTHDTHKTWTLHVTHVTETDRGFYMCQVNTDPMISQQGYLQVVVPPNILDESSSGSNLKAREGDNVTFRCLSDGFPKPKIRWRREDGKTILLNKQNRVDQVEGNILALKSVSRDHFGAYFCIASNGVPPSVSKRITLEVQFPPQIHVPNQLLEVPLYNKVQLECQIEASPKPVTYWTHNRVMINNSSRSIIVQTITDSYRYYMMLTISDIQQGDFGQYLCVATNTLSETTGSIKLNRMKSPVKTSRTHREQVFTDRKIFQDKSKTARHRSIDKEQKGSAGENDATSSYGQETNTGDEFSKISYKKNYLDGAELEDQEDSFNSLNNAGARSRNSYILFISLLFILRYFSVSRR